MQKGGASSKLGVVDAVAAKLGAKTSIGPCEVRSRGGLVILGLHEADHLIALGLVVRLEVPVVDEPGAHLRVVPAAPDGRLGAGVVLVEEFLVLVLLKFGRVSLAATVSKLESMLEDAHAHMTPSETSQSRMSDSDHVL